MSIKLKHSGGNSVSLNPPTSAPTSSEVAFKLPNADGSANQVIKTDGSGNLSFGQGGGTNTPMFLSAPAIAQSGLTSSTHVKVDFTEIHDPQGTYSNGRFTPAVAGYYQFNASVFMENPTSASNAVYNTYLRLYKNGSNADNVGGRGWHQDNAGGDHWQPSISGIIYLDADDYIEVYAYMGTLSSQNWSIGSSGGHFSAFKLIL